MKRQRAHAHPVDHGIAVAHENGSLIWLTSIGIVILIASLTGGDCFGVIVIGGLFLAAAVGLGLIKLN